MLRSALLSAIAVSSPLAAQTLALHGLDPVALCGGTETAGQPQRTESHGGFTYRFATAANAATFRTDPERFGIQLDGACARMGPLSGGGDPGRFLVHDGRIYVFASDACRTTFAQQPDRFLDPDTMAPEPTAEQVAAGERLLQQAIRAHGGAERLRAWHGYHHEQDRSANGMNEQLRLTALLPDRLRLDHDYLQGDKAWRYWRGLNGQHGCFVDEGKPRPMGSAARRELRRDVRREPLFALRAACTGPRVVVGRGPRQVAGIAVDEFELWQDGTATTFGVDQDGRVRTVRCRGRGPEMWFGDLVRVFDDFTTVGGLVLPQQVRATFDGVDAPGLAERRLRLTVDEPVAAATFEPQQ